MEEHHKPHPSAVFEGYYSKFNLPSGAHLALVACSIPNAPQKPHMLSITYVPATITSTTPIFQREIWPKEISMHPNPNNTGFHILIPGIGSIIYSPNNTTTYEISHPEFSFSATTTTRTPWSHTSANSTPENLLVHLPLPLHWHVHSLSSKCTFTLSIPSLLSSFPLEDESGTATLHDEKNWANSFPSAHIWLQARDENHPNRGFCCAGGKILGMEAFLLGYRSSDNNNNNNHNNNNKKEKNFSLDFRPPFALRIANWSPFLSYTTDWKTRTFTLRVQNFRQKLLVKAQAPVGSFFSLSSPFEGGHLENFLGQSFAARISVEVFERSSSSWWGLFLFGGEWRSVRRDVFQEGSLEFGGGFYPPAGSEGRFH